MAHIKLWVVQRLPEYIYLDSCSLSLANKTRYLIEQPCHFLLGRPLKRVPILFQMAFTTHSLNVSKRNEPLWNKKRPLDLMRDNITYQKFITMPFHELYTWLFF